MLHPQANVARMAQHSDTHNNTHNTSNCELRLFCGPLVKILLARERVGVVWGVGAVGCAVQVGRGESGIVSTGLELEV